ncbi:MAG: phosphate/phosphite/phosphonate ABC transporter substrate-binding protein [bacterium]
MAKKGNFIIGIVLAIIIVVAAYWYWEKPLQIFSTMHVEKTQKENKVQKTLYIGFIPHIDPEELVKRWQPIEVYLANELKMPVNITTRSSYDEIITALTNGEVDVCLLGSFAYIQAFKGKRILPLVRRIKYGSSYYHSIIVARKDKSIKCIEDLQGKKFAFTDKESTSGCLLPMVMMKKKGINPNKYFSEMIFTANNSSALTAVRNGSFDAIAISNSVWQDSDQKEKEDLEIIWESAAVPLGPFCIRDDLGKELANKIKKAFLKIGTTGKTKELAEHFKAHGGIEGFEEARDSDYEIIREDYEVIREQWGELFAE